jgi:hypothetical protein
MHNLILLWYYAYELCLIKNKVGHNYTRYVNQQ